ncbi:MAG: hypothetical protein IJ545_06475 [Alphaproteobacteria bacterium]|nr:hypothetical protein [Alphaproteobacteria bacterium]
MWVIFGLLTSVIGATYYICNQKCKLSADIFIIYRGFFVAIMTMPLVFAYFHIFPWQFYMIALFQGLCISYSDYRYFQVFQKFGAENVNALSPLSVFITFILWLILKPETIEIYLKTPVKSCVIFLSIVLIIYAVMKYRNSKIGRDCLKEVLPLLFLSTLIDTSNKIITEYSEGQLLPLTVHRIAITGWIIGFVNLFLNHKNITDYKELIKPKNLRQGWFIFLVALSMITINFGMYYVPNPAYMTSILYLSIIWIVIFNKMAMMFGKSVPYQHIKLKWILLLLFASVTLVLATK